MESPVHFAEKRTECFHSMNTKKLQKSSPPARNFSPVKEGHITMPKLTPLEDFQIYAGQFNGKERRNLKSELQKQFETQKKEAASAKAREVWKLRHSNLTKEKENSPSKLKMMPKPRRFSQPSGSKRLSKATGVKLQAVQKLAEVRREMVTKAVCNKAPLRDRFTTKQAKRIMVNVEGFDVEQLIELQAGLDKSSGYALKIDDDVFQLTKELVEVKPIESTFSVEVIVPSVIEPSFGVGRIMYTILEHAFRRRDGDEEQLIKFLTESYLRNVLFDFACVVE